MTQKRIEMARTSILSLRHRGSHSHRRVAALSAEGVEALRRAVMAGRVGVTYEAVLDMATGDRVGLEARPAWRHPSFGRIRPEAFVPSAISGGFGDALDRVLLLQVLADVGGEFGPAWSDPRSADADPAAPDPSGQSAGADVVFLALQPATLEAEGMADRIANLIVAHGALGKVGVEVPARWLCTPAGLEAATRLAGRGVPMAVNRFENPGTALEAAWLVGARYLKVDSDGRANGGRGWSLAALRAVVGPVSAIGATLAVQGFETRRPLRLPDSLAAAS